MIILSTFLFLRKSISEAMKYTSLIIIALLIFGCQEQQKIGYVNNTEVMDAYQAKVDLEEKYEARDAQFTRRTDSISKAFQLEVQDAQIKSQRMTQSKAQALFDELGQKQQLLQQQIQFEQQQLQQAFNVELDSVATMMKDYIKDYGSTNGYTYILGTSELYNSVMYAKDANDLTKQIIEGLNDSYSSKPKKSTEEVTEEKE